MKVTTKGQVTIPQHIRKFMNVTAYSEIVFIIRDGEVVLVKKDSDSKKEDVECKFAEMRGSKRGGLSTDDWMAETRGE